MDWCPRYAASRLEGALRGGGGARIARGKSVKSGKSGARRKPSGDEAPARFSSGSFAAGIACGAAVVLALVYAPDAMRDASATAVADPSAVADAPAVAAAPEQSPVTFQFIQSLPKSEVVTRLRGMEAFDQPAEPNYQEDADDREFLLQAASFRSREEADTVRARLMLEGMDVAVAAAQQPNGAVWHRVLVGPFASKRAMEGARTRLREMNIAALLVVMDRT